MLSAAMQQVLDILANDRLASGVVPDRLDIAAARASLPPTKLPLPQGTSVSTVMVSGIKCAWVMAADANPARRIAYLHGGGFVAGGFHSHRSLIGWLSAAAGCAVLAVDYPLAPEAKFPVQIKAARRVWHWLADVGPDGPGPADTLCIVGDSAGAAIGLALMLGECGEGGRLPDRAVWFCPMLDLDERTSTFVRSSQRMRELVSAYVRGPADLEDPLASPILANLVGLPPMLVQTGSADDAISDGKRFASNCRAANVDVTLKIWPDMFHVWQRFAPLLPEATEALREAGRFLSGQPV